ncbi:MAG: hypothetical protein AVDCRST_MAG33-1007, partial [uncultured Thermomicrobiales bacterium]
CGSRPTCWDRHACSVGAKPASPVSTRTIAARRNGVRYRHTRAIRSSAGHRRR